MTTPAAPSLPLAAWQCPHCRATWYSGRQTCADCGYGTPAFRPIQAGGPPPADLLPGPEEPPATLPPSGPRASAPAVTDLEAALRRSLAAESALLAELQPLRERCAHLDQLLQGLAYQLLPVVQALAQHLPPARAGAPPAGAPGAAAPPPASPPPVELRVPPQAPAEAGPVAAALHQLQAELHQLQAEVRQLRAERAAGEAGQPRPGTTWLITDAQAQQIEQRLLQPLPGDREDPYAR